MNRTRNILGSQKGASMPMALMLFLICALLSSVVIASSTVALGQQASQSQSTKRYYAVSSAAKMFSDTIEGSTVTVSVTRSHTETTTVNTADGSANTVAGDYSYTVSVDGDASWTAPSDVGEIAVDELLGLSDFGPAHVAEDIWDSDFEFDDGEHVAKLYIDHEFTEVPEGYSARELETALHVDLFEHVLPDGNIELEFSKQDSSRGDEYSVTLPVDADIEKTLSSFESAPTINQDGNSRTETKTVSETKTMHITWHPRGIVKAGEANA